MQTRHLQAKQMEAKVRRVSTSCLNCQSHKRHACGARGGGGGRGGVGCRRLISNVSGTSA